VKWGFSIFYYGFASLACYLLIRNTSYFPTWLGGTGSPMNIYNDFPENLEFTASIEIYYLAQFGKHFSRLFVHFFIRPEGNYYEFGLHHTLSVFLIIFSYLMDHWLIGCFVLLIHDSTDMTLIFARAYKVKNEISLGLQISFGNCVAVPFGVCHFDMDHLQNFHFRLRVCLCNGLQYYKRADTKTGGTIG
jgi:hypothetical protein